MQAQTRRDRIFAKACIALTLLLLTIANTATSARPASHKPPLSSHGSSDQTITLYTTGATPAEAGVPSSHHPVFTGHGPIGRHSGSWLRVLTQPGALQPGAASVVDEQFHGKRDFGLPLTGKLQGVVVTSLEDDGNGSSSIVAVTASFAVDGEDDSLRFFGVHRDDREESHIAVVGGTGRYDGATGFAVVRVAGAHETGRNVSSSRALSFRVHLK
uniref:Dirigent protein n=1 Tax=Leersia perrieri TaxID=77586 RepID=A0A0D9V7K2_9ORYZ